MFQLIALKVSVLLALIHEGVIRQIPSENDSQISVFEGGITEVNRVRLHFIRGFILGILSFEIVELIL